MDKFHRNNVESNPKIYAIEYYSYEIQENTTVTYAISNQSRVFLMKQMLALVGKWHDNSFWDDANVLCFDCSGSLVYIPLYTNYLSI